MIDLLIHDRFIGVWDSDAAPLRAELPGRARDLDPAQIVDALLGLLQDHPRRRQRFRLVLPSSWCYVHRFSAPQRRPTRDMLAFAMEEFLPLEIERLTYDFVRTGPGEYVGVAIESERIRPLLDALTERGVVVDRITIDVLRAAPEDVPDRFIWCDEEHVAVLSAAKQRVRDLRIVRFATELDETAWTECVGAAATDASPADERAKNTVLAGCVSEGRLAALSQVIPGAAVSASEASSAVFAQFDLGRDELAPRSGRTELFRLWRSTAAAAAVALLVLAGGFLFHRTRVEAQMRDIAAWEQKVFADLFPEQKPPAGVATRLASERRRLDALVAPTSTTAAQAPDALKTLHDVVVALPGDARIDLQELRIEGGDVTLRGRTREPQDAERIGQAIGALDAWDADPVRTDRHREAGVQFFVHAKSVAPTPPAKGQP